MKKGDDFFFLLLLHDSFSLYQGLFFRFCREKKSTANEVVGKRTNTTVVSYPVMK